MAKKAKKKIIQKPKNIYEADKYLRLLADEKHTLDTLQAELDKRVNELKKEYAKRAKPHQNKVEKLFEGLYAFANENREELTEASGRKTISLLAGSFGWRITPPLVRLTNTKTALKELKKYGLSRFIRKTEAVDKDAIQRKPDDIKGLAGISIDQSEIFFAKFTSLNIEVSDRTSRLKKLVE